ncbi:hypothetical protein LVJ94_46650 [Pendulispora rubella]|uniref:Uncharacterized protein n=1 Tax=Pendulispora rubella TaxID=2741070 RepID=A0ABZ2L0A5_9BACT
MFAHPLDASRTSFFALSLLGFGILTGCPSKSTPAPDTHAASSNTVTAAPAPAPAVSAAPAAPSASPAGPVGCSVVGPSISIAKGARSDTGATPARLSDGRIVVGYAVGSSPRASVVDLGAQTATAVDVDASTVTKDLGPIEKGSTLSLHRVTPFAATELKMRVLVDASVTAQDKSKRIRCGFADADRIIGSSTADPALAGVSSSLIRNCRSFTDGKNVWALSSWGSTGADGSKRASRWAFHLVGSDGTVHETTLGSRNVPDPTLERYNFDLPASVHEGDAGYVFAGRFNGNLALTRRGEESDAASELSLSWFNAASGMPAVAAADRSVTVLAPIAGKPDLYGVTFPIEATSPKPAVVNVETDKAGAGERSSLSLVRSGADSVLAFVEAKGGGGDAKSVKLVVLDAALKPRTPVLDVPGSGKAAAVKLLNLDPAAGRVLAITLDGGEITAHAVECPH